MRDTITRSFNENFVSILVYKDGKILDDSVIIPRGFDEPKTAEKYIRKNVQLDGKLVDVINVEKLSALYGMSEKDFIALAKPVTERSKETRGYISKTVIAKGGTLLYMASDRSVHDMPVIVPNGMKLKNAVKELAPVGTIGIDIENLHDVETLYVMHPDDFKASAKLMTDYQHYAK